MIRLTQKQRTAILAGIAAGDKHTEIASRAKCSLSSVRQMSQVKRLENKPDATRLDPQVVNIEIRSIARGSNWYRDVLDLIRAKLRPDRGIRLSLTEIVPADRAKASQGIRYTLRNQGIRLHVVHGGAYVYILPRA